MFVSFPSMGGIESISLLRKSSVLKRGILSNPATFSFLMRLSLAISISRPCSSDKAFGKISRLQLFSIINGNTYKVYMVWYIYRLLDIFSSRRVFSTPNSLGKSESKLLDRLIYEMRVNCDMKGCTLTMALCDKTSSVTRFPISRRLKVNK